MRISVISGSRSQTAAGAAAQTEVGMRADGARAAKLKEQQSAAPARRSFEEKNFLFIENLRYIVYDDGEYFPYKLSCCAIFYNVEKYF